VSGGVVGEDTELESILGLASAKRLICRACRSPITANEHRIEIEGSHVHLRTNPAGVDFELGCFDEAFGTVTVGPATTEHAWFGGHTWRYCACMYCGEHLGWLFEGEASRFYGLILDRLDEEISEAGPEA
jgi:hypothetical protein